MGELAEAGCVAFSQADVPLADTQVLLRALQYAATFGYRGLAAAAGSASRTGRRRARRRGRDAPRACPAIPVSAETIALATIFELVRETGARVHLCRLSSAGAVELVRAAKREGLPVTCDVDVHHLHLCDVDIG